MEDTEFEDTDTTMTWPDAESGYMPDRGFFIMEVQDAEKELWGTYMLSWVPAVE